MHKIHTLTHKFLRKMSKSFGISYLTGRNTNIPLKNRKKNNINILPAASDDQFLYYLKMM